MHARRKRHRHLDRADPAGRTRGRDALRGAAVDREVERAVFGRGVVEGEDVFARRVNLHVFPDEVIGRAVADVAHVYPAGCLFHLVGEGRPGLGRVPQFLVVGEEGALCLVDRPLNAALGVDAVELRRMRRDLDADFA